MSSVAEKEREAEHLFSKAHKHTEKTLLRWSPNYESAAEEYEQAAKIYAGTRNVPRATDAWERASKAHTKAKSLFFAARCIDHLAAFLISLAEEPGAGARGGGPDAASSLHAAATRYEEAAGLYALDAKVEKQADALVKAAEIYQRIMKLGAPSSGMKPSSGAAVDGISDPFHEYQRVTREAIAAMEQTWAMNGTTPYRLADVYRGYILQCIRGGDTVAAVQVAKQLLGVVTTSPADGRYDDDKSVFRAMKQPSNAAKTGLEVVVLCLSTGDDVWARQEMGRLGSAFGFCGSAEEQTAAALLDAYGERDPEKLEDVLAHRQELSFLSAEVSRIAKKLKIGGAAKPSAAKAAAPAPAAPAVAVATPSPPPTAVETAREPSPAVDDIGSDEDLR